MISEALNSFYKIEKETAELLDALVDAHREFLDTEGRRVASLIGQIEASQAVNPEWSHQLLAVAVDRLARAER